MIDEVEEVIVEAAEELAEFADDFVTGVRAKFGLLGLVVGLAAGGVGGYFLAQRRLQTKFAKIADTEIDEMREHYRAKGMALDAEKGKGDLEQMVQERGYVSVTTVKSADPPMAVQPPQQVVEAEDEMAGEPDDSPMAVNEVEGTHGIKEPTVRNIFKDREIVVPHEWDQHTELRRRTPDRPYVIHYDERHDMEGYSDVSYTYYAGDDVLCDERDEVIDPENRDNLIGEANLERFGHGNPDSMIVFIRNDNLEILFEVIKSPNSYAEEVAGFSHEDITRGNLQRMRRRERDEEG